jgi:hypothetical protein
MLPSDKAGRVLEYHFACNLLRHFFEAFITSRERGQVESECGKILREAKQRVE